MQHDTSHTWLIRSAAKNRVTGKPLTFSWDQECGRRISYQGFGLDELLRLLLVREAAEYCDQCGVGDCTHEAARLIVAEIIEAECGRGAVKRPDEENTVR